MERKTGKEKEKLESKSESKIEKMVQGALRPPLSAYLLSLRQRTFSVFASNLSTTMSKPKLEAMFCRARRNVDSFIPVAKESGKKRGFASFDLHRS